MRKICIISTELPPSEKFATTADEANENIIHVIKKLKFEIYYIFINENRHYYKENHPEKASRIENIKTTSKFFLLKKDSLEKIKEKISLIIKENNLKNFFIFQNCIDYIDNNPDRKIVMWGVHDNQFPRLKNIYFKKNFIKKILFKIIYFFLNINDYFKIISKLKKANIVLQTGRIYFNKWKKVLKKKPKIIFVPQCTKDYKKLVNEKLEIKFKEGKKNCLLVGQPNTSLASANIKYLCEEVLPILQINKILDKFHFFVIGMIHTKLNPDIDIYIKKWTSSFTVTDYVNDLHTVMYNSDAVIQINPIVPVAGPRIYGWSSLSPLLVASEKIKSQFPELINNHNCYLGSNKDEYLEIFKKIANNDTEIIDLRNNFRKVYDDKWNYEMFIKSLEDIFQNYFIDEKLKDNYFKETI